MNEARLRRSISFWILFFMIAMLLSGISAFPLYSEIVFLNNHKESLPEFMHEWITHIYYGVSHASQNYPFLFYGTDWLAFGHIAIALSFLGPLRNPVRNKWIIDWAILCSVLVIPLALIAGSVRGIPFWHQLVDCSFGILALVPLLILRKLIRRLEWKSNHLH